jgi:hypothetical protein
VSLIQVAKLPPVYLTPSENLPPVSLTPGKFATGVVDTGSEPSLANIFASFWKKIRNDLHVIFEGLGEDDSWKKTWSKKSRDTVPLKTYNFQVSKFFFHKRKRREKRMKISKRNLKNVTLNAKKPP